MAVAVKALLVLFGASSAVAQMPAAVRPIQIVVGGGASVPVGKFSDVHDLGVHADVSVLFNGTGSFRVRPELSYARFNVKELRNLGAGVLAQTASRTADPTSLLSGIANVELAVGGQSLRPYLLAGVGAVSLSAANGNGSARDMKAMVNLGAGVRFRLGSLSGFVEGRVNEIPSDQFKSSLTQVRLVPVTFGLVF